MTTHIVYKSGLFHRKYFAGSYHYTEDPKYIEVEDIWTYDKTQATRLLTTDAWDMKAMYWRQKGIQIEVERII